MKNNKLFVMLWIMLAILLAALDQTCLSTAIPQIARDFNWLWHISWIFSAYMLSSTAIVPIYGKLSDLFGRRLLFIVWILTFIFWSILSWFSQDMFHLIISRAIQWLWWWAIMVNSYAAIWDLFPPHERWKYQGFIWWAWALASVAGPLVWWWLTDTISWRWIFLINIPLGLIALLVIVNLFPKIHEHKTWKSIDYFWAISLISGIVCFLLATIWWWNTYPWGSTVIIGLYLATIILLWAFYRFERLAHDPVMPLNFFSDKTFTVTNICTFLVSVWLYWSTLYIPIFAQNVIWYSATNSGLILAPFSIGIAVSWAITWIIVSRTWKYKRLASIWLVIASLWLFLLSQINIEMEYLDLMFRLVLTWIWIGITMPIFSIVIQNAFSHNKVGTVTWAHQLFKSIWGTIGIAIWWCALNNQLLSNLHKASNPNLIEQLNALKFTLWLEKLDIEIFQQLLSMAWESKIQSLWWINLTEYGPLLKQIFSDSLGNIYLFAAFLMLSSFIISLYLPNIPLRKTNKTALKEIWIELKNELS